MKKAQGIIEVALIMLLVIVGAVSVMTIYGHLTKKDGALMHMSTVTPRK